MSELEPTSFVSHVFNFEQDSRNEMVNIIQYTILGAIFITLLNKALDEYMPAVDKDKGSIAIFVEIIIQCIVLFIGMLFLHRIITYIPTVSGSKYAAQNIISIILPTLILLLSMSKLGEKVSIITDRLTGESQPVKVKHTQPLASQQVPQLLPRSAPTSNPVQDPDFNSMFAGPNTPLVNAQSPDSFEPMPSNFGGSIF
jgi:hypothetical protein